MMWWRLSRRLSAVIGNHRSFSSGVLQPNSITGSSHIEERTNRNHRTEACRSQERVKYKNKNGKVNYKNISYGVPDHEENIDCM